MLGPAGGLDDVGEAVGEVAGGELAAEPLFVADDGVSEGGVGDVPGPRVTAGAEANL